MEEELINFEDYPVVDVEDTSSTDTTDAGSYDIEKDLFDSSSEFQENPGRDQVNQVLTDLDIQDPEGDVLTEFLRRKGISDQGVDIVNERGEHEYVPFKDLSKREQLDILSSPDVDLSDYEIDVINFLRENNTTIQDIVDTEVQRALDKISDRSQQSVSVDSATDEQLFIADLKARYPNLTDEEIQDELEKEMDNEELFHKKMIGVRESFKQEEAYQNEMLLRQREQDRANELNSTIDAINYVANNIDEMHDAFVMTPQDKDDVMRYLFDEDVNGKSEFYKSLSDPESLFKLAWYATKGDEAIQDLTAEYLKEKETVRNLQRELARYKGTSVDRPSVIRRNPDTKKADDRYNMSGYFS